MYEKTLTATANVGTTTFQLEDDINNIISMDGFEITTSNIYFLNYTNNTAKSYAYSYFIRSSHKLNVTSAEGGTLYLTIRYLK